MGKGIGSGAVEAEADVGGRGGKEAFGGRREEEVHVEFTERMAAMKDEMERLERFQEEHVAAVRRVLEGFLEGLLSHIIREVGEASKDNDKNETSQSNDVNGNNKDEKDDDDRSRKLAQKIDQGIERLGRMYCEASKRAAARIVEEEVATKKHTDLEEDNDGGTSSKKTPIPIKTDDPDERIVRLEGENRFLKLQLAKAAAAAATTSELPSIVPSTNPSSNPSHKTSTDHNDIPSHQPSAKPSSGPTMAPSDVPTF